MPSASRNAGGHGAITHSGPSATDHRGAWRAGTADRGRAGCAPLVRLEDADAHHDRAAVLGTDPARASNGNPPQPTQRTGRDPRSRGRTRPADGTGLARELTASGQSPSEAPSGAQRWRSVADDDNPTYTRHARSALPARMLVGRRDGHSTARTDVLRPRTWAPFACSGATQTGGVPAVGAGVASLTAPSRPASSPGCGRGGTAGSRSGPAAWCPRQADSAALALGSPSPPGEHGPVTRSHDCPALSSRAGARRELAYARSERVDGDRGGPRRGTAAGPEGSVVCPIYQGTPYSVGPGTGYHDIPYIRLNSLCFPENAAGFVSWL